MNQNLHFRNKRFIDNRPGLHVAVVCGRYLVNHLAMFLRENHVLVRQVRLKPVAPRRLVAEERRVVGRVCRA